jgi:hypothetical protein
MKKWILVVALSANASWALSQVTNTIVNNKLDLTKGIMGRSAGHRSNDKVAGSPFAYERYGNGTVLLKNSMKASGFELYFNQFTNEIWYAWAGEYFVFQDTVVSASIKFADGEDSVLVILKSMYPPVGGQSLTSLYEVLEEGSKLHLLKLTKKEIAEVFTKDGGKEQMFMPYNFYFVFDVAEQRMYPITSRMKAKEMPDHLGVLTHSYCLSNGDPKKWGDWRKMVQWINGQP